VTVGDPVDQARLEKAARLLGKSMSGFFKTAALAYLDLVEKDLERAKREEARKGSSERARTEEQHVADSGNDPSRTALPFFCVIDSDGSPCPLFRFIIDSIKKDKPMKRPWIVAPVLIMIWVSGFAEAPSQAPLTSSSLAKILAQAGVTGSCAMPQGEVLFAATGAKSVCSASANCASGTVSCYDNTNPADCHGFDRSCPGEQGHVTCEGVTTWCPTQCPCECCSGTFRQQACCRCSLTSDCYDCMICDYGYAVYGICE
jgi:hypothetical protein